jgi:hypothetical protein
VQRKRADAGPFIAIGGLVVAAFLYGYSAIALPSFVHSVVLPLCWLLLLGLAFAWSARHPRRVVVLPAIAIVLWFAVLLAGG